MKWPFRKIKWKRAQDFQIRIGLIVHINVSWYHIAMWFMSLYFCAKVYNLSIFMNLFTKRRELIGQDYSFYTTKLFELCVWETIIEDELTQKYFLDHLIGKWHELYKCYCWILLSLHTKNKWISIITARCGPQWIVIAY